MNLYAKFWKPLLALPTPVWVLAGAAFVNRVGTMVMPFLALYLTQSLGFSAKQAGVLVAVYGIGALIVSPITGVLCDKFGTLRMMIGSLLAGGTVMLLFPLAKSYEMLLLCSFLLAITSEGFRPAAMAAISEYAEGTDRKPAYSLVRLAINLGMSVGPVLGAVLVKISFPSIFWVDGLTCFAAALVLLPSLKAQARKMKTQSHPVVSADQAKGFLEAAKDPRLLYLLIALLPVCVVFFQHESTMPIFMVRDLKLDEAWYGICFTLNTVMIIFTEIPLTIMTNHWPLKRGMALGASFFAVGFGMMAMTTNGWGILVSVALWTIGEMFMFPSLNAYLSEISPTNRRGFYMGMFMMSFSVAFILAPLVGTYVLETFGAKPLWVACLALGFLSAFFFTRIHSIRPH